jgi:FAD/FMN-containing dehydrogenase
MTTTTASALSPEQEQTTVDELRSSMRGAVIDRTHPEYDAARQVWNGLIDKRPAVIARCVGVADVVEAVRVARELRPTVSIRGGGHQVAGTAIAEDGLVIDLSPMKGVHVDPITATARAQAGVTWGELDRETQLVGLATPGGEVSLTGVAGLTLGGGMGLVQRRFGLSCDNLRSIEIVSADGMVRTASRDEHPDLFWAARGGGRGLGVVTSFEFDLHPLGPDVAHAQIVYPYEQAVDVMRAFRDIAATMPETVSPELALWSVPPDPELPQEMHGMKAVFVGGVYAGPPGEADAALAPLRELGEPLVDLSATRPYVDVQQDLDALVPDGIRSYMKSHFADELSDDSIATLVECDAKRPNPLSLLVIRTLGGAVARVGDDESAYPHRSAAYNVSLDAFWDDPALDETAIEWSRSTWDAWRPFANGGVYVNFSGLEDEAEGLRTAVLGSSEARLDAIRAEYDPDGLFEAAAHAP